ncbi:MAG: hypothetical protein CMM25_04820 [Rhodospirillaceae bacterium]|nr:hypothetical protein [Rhodospirillaceae bacterium]|tara:strand:- start:133 stop:990 length:858 start_codon:yes stop_codon:yes gene_type:complete
MNRRKTLQLISSAPLFGSISRRAESKKETNYSALTELSVNNQSHLSLIHRKLHYSYDQKPVHWFIQAERQGLLDNKVQHFWDMHVGFISITKNLPNDKYEVTTLSVIFYLNRQTNQLIEEFQNPYTKEVLRIKQPKLRVSTKTYDQFGITSQRRPTIGFTMKEYGAIGPAWIIGPEVWCRADTGFINQPNQNINGKMKVVNDWSTFNGSIKEIIDSKVNSAYATQVFNDINTWPTWLNMPSSRGNYISRGFGFKCWSMESMPIIWKERMKSMYPKQYKDPYAMIS